MRDDRALRLISAAVAFRDRDVPPERVPTSFESVKHAVACMRDVLWHESHVQMQDTIDGVEDPMAHAVDLESDAPGIVSSIKPFHAHHVQREDVPDVVTQATDDDTDVLPTRNAPAATGRGPSAEKEMAKALQRAEREAARDIERDAKTEAKARENEAERQRRANESPEERRERLDEAKRQREERKLQREERASQPPEDPKPPPSTKKRSSDEDCIEPMHRILPRRLRVRNVVNGKTKVYASPVPGERHVNALARVDLDENAPLAQALVATTFDPIDPAILIVQGPPGTGKTTKLVEMINSVPFTNALVCAGSNVAVANIYRRLIDTPVADDVALCMPPSRVPDGLVVCSDDASRRVVCATVSGRNGPHLVDRAFDAVFVDEAAQLSEAMTWTLIRREVQKLILVGDTQQLRAIAASEASRACAHDRSLMERLVDNGAPNVTLDVQRRMHPEIAAFPVREYYPGLHTDFTGAHLDVPYDCIRVDASQAQNIGTSWSNPAEIDVVERVVRDNASHKVVVVCPYQATCRAILARKLGVAVHTVDSFQGHEADVVVLPIVRTGHDVGFWSDARRLVVALTRAKLKLVVVGSFDWTTSPLKELADDARARRLV